MSSSNTTVATGRNNPIWSSAEANAWSRDFRYVDYVNTICPAYKVEPVNEHMYKKLRVMFNECMEYDMANGV
jgi:hypothetical protein